VSHRFIYALLAQQHAEQDDRRPFTSVGFQFAGSVLELTQYVQ
jgi:hypothetical protein